MVKQYLIPCLITFFFAYKGYSYETPSQGNVALGKLNSLGEDLEFFATTAALMQLEKKYIESVPESFAEKFKQEISEKSLFLSALEKTLTTDSKHGQTESTSFMTSLSNTGLYTPPTDRAWKSFQESFKSVLTAGCVRDAPFSNKFLCSRASADDGRESADTFVIKSKIIESANEKNWPKALSESRKKIEINPGYRLVHKILQRIYSFKHQGSGKVAIGGM